MVCISGFCITHLGAALQCYGGGDVKDFRRFLRAQDVLDMLKLGTAPLSNSWMIIIIWLYIAPNRTSNIDWYWVGAVLNVEVDIQELGCQDVKGRSLHVKRIWGDGV